MTEPGGIPPEAMQMYTEGQEADRLANGHNQLEHLWVHKLLRRFLPPAPARVIDVGGGPGAHVLWLAQHGYVVDLLDVRHASSTRPLRVRHHRASRAVSPGRSCGFEDSGTWRVFYRRTIYVKAKGYATFVLEYRDGDRVAEGA